MVFVSTEHIKCFGCGADGHLVLSCPERTVPAAAWVSSALPGAVVTAEEVPQYQESAGLAAPKEPVLVGMSTPVDPVLAVNGVEESQANVPPLDDCDPLM